MPTHKDNPTILIVEDDLDVADMLNAYFRVQGYQVLTANYGEDGLRLSQTTPPDLVILDIRLPDMDGFEVAKRLRANRGTSAIPIIFLTDMRERQSRLQGLEAGGDDYITKPFDIQELRLRVRNALTRATQTTLRNPVTNLPEGQLVDERLKELLKNDQWTLLVISLQNLDAFRESYGFIAADDVLRAASLMIANTLTENGHPQNLLGHLTVDRFLVATSPDEAKELHHSIKTRLEQSLDYFYPLKDRQETNSQALNRLAVGVTRFNHTDGIFTSVDALKTRLIQSKKI